MCTAHIELVLISWDEEEIERLYDGAVVSRHLSEPLWWLCSLGYGTVRQGDSYTRGNETVDYVDGMLHCLYRLPLESRAKSCWTQS